MTANEFKKVLTESNIDFSVWGYEGIINIVSSYCSKMEKEYRNEGEDALADLFREKADKTYDYLESIGYYNN